MVATAAYLQLVTKGWTATMPLLRYLAITGYINWSRHGNTINQALKKISLWSNCLGLTIKATSRSLTELAELHRDKHGDDLAIEISINLQRQAVQWLAVEHHLGELAGEYKKGIDGISILINLFKLRKEFKEINDIVPALNDQNLLIKLDMKLVLKMTENPEIKVTKKILDAAAQKDINRESNKDKETRINGGNKQDDYMRNTPRDTTRGRPSRRYRGGQRGRPRGGRTQKRTYGEYQQNTGQQQQYPYQQQSYPSPHGFNTHHQYQNHQQSAPYPYAPPPFPTIFPTFSPFQPTSSNRGGYGAQPPLKRAKIDNTPRDSTPNQGGRNQGGNNGNNGNKNKEDSYKMDNGVMIGDESMIKGICRFWEKGRCRTPNHWQCGFHHMCRWCFAIDDHHSNDCISNGTVQKIG